MHKTSNIIREGTQAGRLWRDYVDESWPTHSTNKVKVKASMYKIEWTEKMQLQSWTQNPGLFRASVLKNISTPLQLPENGLNQLLWTPPTFCIYTCFIQLSWPVKIIMISDIFHFAFSERYWRNTLCKTAGLSGLRQGLESGTFF